jgi:hypothetical protein
MQFSCVNIQQMANTHHYTLRVPISPYTYGSSTPVCSTPLRRTSIDQNDLTNCTVWRWLTIYYTIRFPVLQDTNCHWTLQVTRFLLFFFWWSITWANPVNMTATPVSICFIFKLCVTEKQVSHNPCNFTLMLFHTIYFHFHSFVKANNNEIICLKWKDLKYVNI